jgi:hypothetical protein
MRIRLKNGDVIGGFFGDGSFASTNTEGSDLYLATAWRLDAETLEFTEIAERTAGILICRDQCEYIELFEPEEKDSGQRKPETEPSRLGAIQTDRLGKEGLRTVQGESRPPSEGRQDRSHAEAVESAEKTRIKRSRGGRE